MHCFFGKQEKEIDEEEESEDEDADFEVEIEEALESDDEGLDQEGRKRKRPHQPETREKCRQRAKLQTKSVCWVLPRPLSGHFYHTWAVCLPILPLQNAPKFKMIAKGGSQMLRNGHQSMGSLLTKLDNSTA